MVEYNRENKIFDDDDREIWELTHLSLSFKSKSAVGVLTHESHSMLLSANYITVFFLIGLV